MTFPPFARFPPPPHNSVTGTSGVFPTFTPPLRALPTAKTRTEEKSEETEQRPAPRSPGRGRAALFDEQFPPSEVKDTTDVSHTREESTA
jgi:hypothetical protein